MEFKQLQSFNAVVEYQSFTKAAAKLFVSQPTISSHIRSLEQELNTALIIRTTKNIEITKKGLELYECASHIMELHDNLIRRWSDETKNIIHIGASTIPSAYILPEVLPQYGKINPNTYFVIHQDDSNGIVNGLLNGLFDIGMIGMVCDNDALTIVPFYEDRMVLITPVNEHFLNLHKNPEPPLCELLKEPIILRENGSGSQKSANAFLKSIGIREEDLKVTARINDQESIKNLVSGGLGISIVSEKAVKNFVEEKRLLMFELPENAARRNLYLIHKKNNFSQSCMQQFIQFILSYYKL